MKLYIAIVFIVVLASITACSSSKYSEKNIQNAPSYCTKYISQSGDMAPQEKKLGIIFKTFECDKFASDTNIVMISVFKNHDTLVNMLLGRNRYAVVENITPGDKFADDDLMAGYLINKEKKDCGNGNFAYFKTRAIYKKQTTTGVGKIRMPGNYITSFTSYTDDNMYIEIMTFTEDKIPNNETDAKKILQDFGITCLYYR